MKQRKDYVLSWWRQALAKDAHVQMLHSPLPVSPAKRVEANPLLAGSGGGGGAVADARRSKEERVALRRPACGLWRARPDGRWRDGAARTERAPTDRLLSGGDIDGRQHTAAAKGEKGVARGGGHDGEPRERDGRKGCVTSTVCLCGHHGSGMMGRCAKWERDALQDSRTVFAIEL